MPININKFVPRPGLVNQQGHLPDPTELVCVEIPKVFDQCLIKRCLKYREGPDTDKTDCELRSNPLNCPKKYLGCKDFKVKLLSVELIPLKHCYGFQKVIICYMISFWADYLDEDGCIKCELFEINRRDVIGKFYSPGPIAQISINSPSGHFPIEFDPDFFKLELVAEALCGEFCKVDDGCIVLDITLGYYLIVKYEIIVQLLIPAYDYCPIPKPPCDEPIFIDEDVCKLFEKAKIPKFYPDQNLEPLFHDRDGCKDHDDKDGWKDRDEKDGWKDRDEKDDWKDRDEKDDWKDQGDKELEIRDFGKGFCGKDFCFRDENDK